MNDINFQPGDLVLRTTWDDWPSGEENSPPFRIVGESGDSIVIVVNGGWEPRPHEQKY